MKFGSRLSKEITATETPKVKIKAFTAKKDTNRYRKGQKVWVLNDFDFGNHCYVVFKWRGNGRYVKGVQDKWSCNKKTEWLEVIGEDGFKEMEVEKDFHDRLLAKIVRKRKG